MITIEGKNNLFVQRSLINFFEPYAVKLLQKKNHTFFVYRCSEYLSFEFFLKKEQYKCKNKNIVTILSRYWSAIDIIHIIIQKQPFFEATQKYFISLREIELQEKEIKNFNCYEVKIVGKRKSIISVNTMKLYRELKAINKEFQLVEIKISGNLNISSTINSFKEGNYVVKTHYGRKGYTLRAPVKYR